MAGTAHSGSGPAQAGARGHSGSACVCPYTQGRTAVEDRHETTVEYRLAEMMRELAGNVYEMQDCRKEYDRAFGHVEDLMVDMTRALVEINRKDAPVRVDLGRLRRWVVDMHINEDDRGHDINDTLWDMRECAGLLDDYDMEQEVIRYRSEESRNDE